jgi:hypothetical protein
LIGNKIICNLYSMLWVLLLSLVTAHLLTDYSYYILALKKCQKYDPWTLHGLWPELNPHQWPQYCHSSELNYHQIRHLFPRLYANWSNCHHQGSWLFWSHEWSKHGTCSGMNQSSYFTYTLNLYDRAYARGDVNGYCPNWVGSYRSVDGDWAGQCLLSFALNGTIILG